MNRDIVWSYGGGVQTIAILTLIAQGKLQKPDLVIMADTGRERSSTWRYYNTYARPILDELKLTFVIASHDLARVDLYASTGELLLPAFTLTGKLPTFCSTEWKRDVVRRHLRRIGYGPKKPVWMWYGMSLDEVHRLRLSGKKWLKNHYPLCFDVPMRQHECILQIESFGLPAPAKSACWMCPNLNDTEWLEMKKNDPEDFKKAKDVDRLIRRNDTQGGLFLHRHTLPLDQVDLAVEQKSFPLWECADSCMT